MGRYERIMKRAGLSALACAIGIPLCLSLFGKMPKEPFLKGDYNKAHYEFYSKCLTGITKIYYPDGTEMTATDFRTLDTLADSRAYQLTLKNHKGRNFGLVDKLRIAKGSTIDSKCYLFKLRSKEREELSAEIGNAALAIAKSQNALKPSI